MKYIRTYRPKSEGGGQTTHLEGIGDSYTLCGLDTAGDTWVHRKQPEFLQGRHRVTCSDCNRVIAIVKEHLSPNK